MLDETAPDQQRPLFEELGIGMEVIWQSQ